MHVAHHHPCVFVRVHVYRVSWCSFKLTQRELLEVTKKLETTSKELESVRSSRRDLELRLAFATGGQMSMAQVRGVVCDTGLSRPT